MRTNSWSLVRDFRIFLMTRYFSKPWIDLVRAKKISAIPPAASRVISSYLPNGTGLMAIGTLDGTILRELWQPPAEERAQGQELGQPCERGAHIAQARRDVAQVARVLFFAIDEDEATRILQLPLNGLEIEERAKGRPVVPGLRCVI